MQIGFTGTQAGMSELQKITLHSFLFDLKQEDMVDGESTYFHHGDCIGADAEAHEIARSLDIHVIIHPPNIHKKRAFCNGTAYSWPPLPYLERNRIIVDTCEILFVAPKGPEILRSGTWSTYRYAMKLDKAVILLER